MKGLICLWSLMIFMYILYTQGFYNTIIYITLLTTLNTVVVFVCITCSPLTLASIMLSIPNLIFSALSL